jgi:hypothetical protein
VEALNMGGFAHPPHKFPTAQLEIKIIYT